LHYNNGTIAFIPLDQASPKSESQESGFRKSFYGIFKRGDLIYTDKMTNTDAAWLSDWLKGKVEADKETIEKQRLHIYSAIADFNSVRLFRLTGAIPNLARGKSQIDEIDMFWGMLKSRLIKFRGLNGSTLYLHVKETEFRYNYRDTDIYELLMDILHKRPLHYSKAVR